MGGTGSGRTHGAAYSKKNSQARRALASALEAELEARNRRLADRDRSYRQALGLAGGEALPAELGNCRGHGRSVARAEELG